jgi:hypothetical protein
MGFCTHTCIYTRFKQPYTIKIHLDFPHPWNLMSYYTATRKRCLTVTEKSSFQT